MLLHSRKRFFTHSRKRFFTRENGSSLEKTLLHSRKRFFTRENAEELGLRDWRFLGPPRRSTRADRYRIPSTARLQGGRRGQWLQQHYYPMLRTNASGPEIGLPGAGRRPAGGPILKLSRSESGRNPPRKLDFPPGNIIA